MEISFPRRFRGPLTSANGGYAAGRLAAFVDADEVEVTLRRPPPLERALEVRRDGDSALLLDGDAVVAEARAAELDIDPPLPVTRAAAEHATARHVRIGNPVFGECFVCGVRPEDDGLGIYAGLVAGREPLHAAPWTATETAPEIVWAAIDCPGAYAVGASDGRGGLVLGRMTARIVSRARRRRAAASSRPGRSERMVGSSSRGRRSSPRDGELLALARQTWIAPR